MAEGMIVKARRAIVALPPTLCGRMVYDPPLPGFRDQLTQRMPQGAVIKCMAVYDKPFWREAGLTGQATSDTGPLKLTFDNSPPSGSPGVLLGFLEGRQARLLGREPLDLRREVVLDCFSRYFGPDALKPNRYIERSWAEEEWTRGCYGCYMPPGRLDRVWHCAERAVRAAPLGRRGDRDRVERLHGRRRPVGPARRRRGQSRPRGGPRPSPQARAVKPAGAPPERVPA